MLFPLHISLGLLLFSGAKLAGYSDVFAGKTVEGRIFERAASVALMQGAASPEPVVASQEMRFIVVIKDENGMPVSTAKVTILKGESEVVVTGETDFAGKIVFTSLDTGPFRVRVEKLGYYVGKTDDIRPGELENLELTIGHEQEVRESMDVTNSPPAIDPAKTVSSETLGAREINNIPYPSSRDFRNILPFFPRVHRDPSGQVHIDGAASYQTSYQLDGFNITHPASGLLEVRITPDALRSIEIQSSRYSAEYGKASGGVVNLTTGMGDERYRVSVTDFLPTFQFLRGFNLNTWTPRFTFGGPIKKGRSWFYTAADAELSVDIRSDLPKGVDRNSAERLNGLAKTQINLSPTNLLNAGFFFNKFHSEYAGLSRFTPQGTAPELKQNAYILTIRDQIFRNNGQRFEFGVAASQFQADTLPHGSTPYQIGVELTTGSFFKRSEILARRFQATTSVTLSPTEWRGSHEVKFGLNVDHIGYNRFLARKPIQILRSEGTLSREIDFDGTPIAKRDNLEISGFLQDRWALTNRVVLESGLRLDRDEILRRFLLSPRLALSALLTGDGETRLAMGLGLYHDATNPDFITRPLEGSRVDSYYGRDGKTLTRQPIETMFTINERKLRAPRFVNWSAELERKMPAEVYLKLEFIGRRGSQGFAFDQQGGFFPEQLVRFVELGNSRRDRYDAVTITARRAFLNSYNIFGSYTRSAARTNAVLDFTLDTPIFSQQQGGPLDWDAPNRFLSWGWVPLVKKFDLAYSVEWRSGYPFSVIDTDRKLVEEANSRRFPSYFSLNLYAERRFSLLGVNLALRAGFNNITNRQNPTDVNNNVDSPQFLRYGGIQGRAFNGRIRFLGRK
jgi:hypothetical protein